METILVSNRKGGAGKTTVVVNLAAAANTPLWPVLVIDADPQASATFWYERRTATTPLLSSASPEGVAAVLKDAKAARVGTAVIDSPPVLDRSMLNLMRLADFILIPTRCGAFDLAAIAGTVQMARESRRPFAVLLNATPPARLDEEPSIVTEARQLLDEMGAPVLSRCLTQRAVFSHSIISGEVVSEYAPQSAAAAEIGAVWKNIKRTLKATGVR